MRLRGCLATSKWGGFVTTVVISRNFLLFCCSYNCKIFATVVTTSYALVVTAVVKKSVYDTRLPFVNGNFIVDK